ncbi:MAG: PilZ domain-containing protein [Acidithiobacillus sp.]|uniref:PilZ domain-containing protein n=1 Tax=Acidithiobacillus sp. TaxID=1872118 RepID=UPI003D032A6B
MDNRPDFIKALFSPAQRQEAAQARRILADLQQFRELQVLLTQGMLLARTELLSIAEPDGLVIDELRPDPAQAALLAGSEMLLWGLARGIPSGIAVRVVRHEIWQGYGAFRLPPPVQVYQLQRRQNLRAEAPAEMRASLQRRGARTMDALVRDVGAGGLACRVAVPRDYPLSVGERLDAVHLDFAGEHYALRAQIRHLQGPFRRSGAIYQDLGLAFEAAPARLQEQIVHYAMRCNRQELRRAYL